MTTYNNNCVGIATFKAKPTEEIISDLQKVGNIADIVYTGLGVYTGSFVESLGSAEVYKIDFSAPPGFLPGVIAQNESAFTLGLKDSDGNWTDAPEFMSVAIFRLTEPTE